MELAKPCFDIGMITNAIDRVEPFWRDALAIPFDHVIAIEPGFSQHRYQFESSIIKLNARPTDDVPPSGYSELFLARDGLASVQALQDPDGNRVTLVPRGYRGITQLAVTVRVRDLAAHRHFYRHVLSLPSQDENAFQVGAGIIFLEQDDDVATEQSIWGKGWRYLTFQIFDVRRELARFLDHGGRPNAGFQQLSDIARVAMVQDPDGNWLELSQRTTVTGRPLEP